uniref:G-protein coupled receptors family 1 profile domain-containing protein n=1 Tax=Plectus sambesii TaxID=2011161 RepID=A0A914XHM9_9BILA
MCDLFCVQFILSVSFTSITLPIYLLFVAVLIKNRHEPVLSSSFFRILVSLGIADIASMLNTLFLFRLPSRWALLVPPLLRTGQVGVKVANVGLWALMAVQHIGVFLLALNRFMAYLTPIRYRLMWTERTTAKAIILQWTLGFAFSIPVLIFEQNHYSPDNQTLFYQWADADTLGAYFNWSIGIIVALSLVLSMMYATIFVKAYKTSQMIRACSMKTPDSERIAFRMTQSGFLSTVTIILLSVLIIARQISWFVLKVAMDVNVFYFLFYTLTDIY